MITTSSSENQIPACRQLAEQPGSDPRAHLDADHLAQTPPARIVYIDNTPMFVQIAEGLGIRSILHVDLKSTCAKLASFGLQTQQES